jgi:peptide maturation system acyl carrier-related protein
MRDAREIEGKLVSILEERFSIRLDSLPGDWGDISLLGSSFCFAARDLLALLFFIERDFRIQVHQAALSDGKFSTFNDIIGIIRDAENAANEESVGIRPAAQK